MLTFDSAIVTLFLTLSIGAWVVGLLTQSLKAAKVSALSAAATLLASTLVLGLASVATLRAIRSVPPESQQTLLAGGLSASMLIPIIGFLAGAVVLPLSAVLLAKLRTNKGSAQ